MSGNRIEEVAAGVTGDERHDMRLMTLLRAMVREKRLKGAAETLGLDPRTIQTSMERGDLSELVRMALERHVLADGDEQAARQRERIDALEQGMEALKLEFRRGLEDAGTAMKEAVQALREEWIRAPKRMEGGTAQPGTPQGARAETEVTQEAGKPERTSLRRRLYPELVTREPAPDDEEVYGEAWPLIEEWRGIWNAGHVGTGKGMKWLRTEERVRELEVAMLEEHGLTLPPETMPLTGLWRSSQLNWRRETLRDVRRAVAWRRLARRILTFGMWGRKAGRKGDA